MPTCPHCRAEVPEGAAACSTCGSTLTPEPVEVTAALQPSPSGESVAHPLTSKPNKLKPVLIGTLLGVIAVTAAIGLLSRRSEASVDPLTLMPAATTIVAMVDGPTLWGQLKPMSQKATWVKDMAEAFAHQFELDLDRDVMSWLGRGAVSFDVSNMMSPTILGVLAVRDERAADAALNKVKQKQQSKGTKFNESRYEEVTIYTAPSSPSSGPMFVSQLGLSFARAGGCLIVASAESAVKGSIDLLRKKEGAKSLAENETWKKLKAELPSGVSAMAAIDIGSMVDLISPMMTMGMGAAGSQQQMQAVLEMYKSFGWMGFAGELDSRSVRFSWLSTFRPGMMQEINAAYAKAPLADQASLQLVPRDALGFFAASWDGEASRESWDKSMEWVKKMGAEAQQPLKLYEGLEKTTGLSLRDDVLGVLQGEMNFSFVHRKNDGPRVIASLPVKDEATLKEKWAKIRKGIEMIGMKFTATKQQGVEILSTHLGGSNLAVWGNMLTQGQFPMTQLPDTDLAFALVGNRLLISNGTSGIAAALDGKASGDTIAGNSGYQTMKSFIAGENTMFGYVDLAAVADQYIPGGKLGPWSFEEAVAALKQVRGVVVYGRYKKESFGMTLAVGANFEQVCDLFQKASGPMQTVMQNRMSGASPFGMGP